MQGILAIGDASATIRKCGFMHIEKCILVNGNASVTAKDCCYYDCKGFAYGSSDSYEGDDNFSTEKPTKDFW